MQPFRHRWPDCSPGAAGFDLLLINRVQAVWFPATGPARAGDAAATQILPASAPHGPAGTWDLPCGWTIPKPWHPARWVALSWVRGKSLPPKQGSLSKGERFLPAILTWSLVWERNRAGWVSPAWERTTFGASNYARRCKEGARRDKSSGVAEEGMHMQATFQRIRENASVRAPGVPGGDQSHW